MTPTASLDEQEEMARERGLAIDREGFEVEMKQQRERARASWKGGASRRGFPR
jgi:alanyl-tRNA synthetase